MSWLACRGFQNHARGSRSNEGNAVTVAYVQGNRPGKSFAQNQRSAPGVSAAKSQGDGKPAQQQGTQGGQPKRKRTVKTRYGPMDPNKCAGKCCFRCGKEGHFIVDCSSGPTKCLYLAFDGSLKYDDAPNGIKCRCACGQHTHFMSHVNEEQALVVLTRKDRKAAK